MNTATKTTDPNTKVPTFNTPGTKTSHEEMQAKRKELAKGLSGLLADTYTLYNSTQLFHWNIEGQSFTSLHNLFEEQYRELAEAIDLIAERVRSLGYYTPGSLSEIQERTILTQEKNVTDSGSMLKLLIESHQKIGMRVHELQKTAEQANDEASFDLLVGRQRVHEKTTWMLESQAGRGSEHLA